MVRRARQPLARDSPTAHRPTGHSDSNFGVVGVGLTKGLSEKSLSSSLSSIHILYNQALVDGLSVSYVPATWIDNIQLEYQDDQAVTSRCSTRVVSGPDIMYRRGRGYAPASLALVSHSHDILLHDFGASRQSTSAAMLTVTGAPAQGSKAEQGQPQSLFVTQSVHLIKGCSFSFLDTCGTPRVR